MSPTNARNGSIDTLSDASSTHSMAAANSKAGASGIANNDSAASTAPARK